VSCDASLYFIPPMKSKYKNVYFNTSPSRSKNKKKWIAAIMINGQHYRQGFNDEKEAAKYVDLCCIKAGIPQRNDTYKTL